MSNWKRSAKWKDNRHGNMNLRMGRIAKWMDIKRDGNRVLVEEGRLPSANWNLNWEWGGSRCCVPSGQCVCVCPYAHFHHLLANCIHVSHSTKHANSLFLISDHSLMNVVGVRLLMIRHGRWRETSLPVPKTKYAGLAPWKRNGWVLRRARCGQKWCDWKLIKTDESEREKLKRHLCVREGRGRGKWLDRMQIFLCH